MKDNAGSYPNRDFARNLDNSNDFFLFRAKLHLGWSPTSWFTAFVEGREAYAASDTRPITETDNLDVHQAYLRLGDPKLFPVSLKLGRQELIYGDQRYIGNADWSNLQRSFDAVKLRFENEMFWVDAFTGHQVIPYNHHFNQSNDHDWFSGIYAATRKLAPWQDTEVYFLARNVGPKSPTAITPTLGGPGERDIYTLGTRWKSTPGMLGNWDYAAEVAWQFGDIYQGTKRLDHRALAVNVSGGYIWKDTFGVPRLGLGYDYGSGDSNPFDGTNETVELLFGTNHRLYGNMDLMGLRNMHIPRLEASFKPHADVTIALEWLAFWLADTADFFYPESGAGPQPEWLWPQSGLQFLRRAGTRPAGGLARGPLGTVARRLRPFLPWRLHPAIHRFRPCQWWSSGRQLGLSAGQFSFLNGSLPQHIHVIQLLPT